MSIPCGGNMEHTNKVSEVTDPEPNPWMSWQEEDKPKDTGSLKNGLSMKKPLFGKYENPGGRNDATTKS